MHPFTRCLILLSVTIVVFLGMADQSKAILLSGATYVAPGTCLYGTAYADGCLSAPAGTGNTTGPLYQNATFFADSMQSGQTQYFNAPATPSSHPPPWNVAGVDYPVGVPTGTTFKVHGVDSEPAGCSYSGGTVTCANHAGIVFSAWDNTDVLFDLASTVTGTVEFVNCKFSNGTHTSGDFSTITLEASASANILFHYNYVNANAINFPVEPVRFLSNLSGTGTITIEYNYFGSIIGLGLTSGTGTAVIRYNFINGLNYDSPAHGEFDIFNGIATSGGTLGSLTTSFNTILQPSTFGGGATSPFFDSTGADDGATFTTVNVDHNTAIINLFAFTMSQSGTAVTIPTSGALSCQALAGAHLVIPSHTNETLNSASCTGEGVGGTSPYHGTGTANTSQTVSPAQTAYAVVTSAALEEISRNTYGTVNYTANYVYPGGAFFCVQATGSYTAPVINFSGNVDVYDGSTFSALGACNGTH